MDHYSGADPIVSLINYSRDFKNSIRYALFYRDTEIVVDEIVETASFLLCHDTQYERHFRRSHIVPGSETDSITFYDSDGQTESVSPVQPNKGNFVDRTHTYPREATNHLTDCEWCSAGSKTCPNCGGESVVSCPECYSHRGGDCSRCEGTGKVDCGDCHGSGTCGTCDGDGRNPCTNCSGNGTVEFEEYQEETCQNCNGTGSTGENSCSACNGSGTVTRKYMRTEQCGPCSGRGTVQCTTCRGSGYCPRCSGSGKVDDEKCGGTGRCQFCQGEGTKTCTTCRGSASVTCPVCEGVNQVLRYTTDVFEYKHMIDTDTVHPGLFTDRTDDIEDASTITLPDLTETTVQNYLGLVNGNIKERLNEAISAYEGLVKTADERQYSNGVNRSDKINQDKLYDSLVRKIESTWDSTASDSYHTDYQLELDDQARRQDHDDIYQNLLFQTGTYNLVPLSLINLWMGETKKQLYAIGPEDDYEVKYPSFKLSPVKVTLFSAFLLGAIGSVATYPAVYGTMLAFSLAGMTLPVYLTAGLLSVPALIGWGYTVYRTRTSEDPSVVTVVGGDDALNTTFLAVLAHSISYDGVGEVRDPIYTDLAKQLFEDLTLGSSISYSVTFEDDGRVQLVSLSASSYERMDSEVRQLLERSEALIGIFGRGINDIRNAYETFDAVANEFEGEVAIMTDHPDVVMGDIQYAVNEVSLSSLRESYLNQEENSNEQVVKLIQEVG